MSSAALKKHADPKLRTHWPVQEFKRNQGSVGTKKITFVGASFKFVHKVLRDMLLVGGFNDVHMVVHDLDPEPMKIVADLLERIARQTNSNVKVSRTLDRTEALKGADAVILSITTGGLEADTRSWEVCAKYGIPVGIGDTLGPAALARNLRTIPVVLDLAREMEKLCPSAVLLNFTNPMSALTAAVLRHSSIRTFGLCHSADELYEYFGKVFNVPKSRVDMDIAGVNHQAFVLKLAIDGVDRTKDLLPAVEASDAKLEDNMLETYEEDVELQKDIYRIVKAWPSTGSTHLAEFYPFFYTPRRLDRTRAMAHKFRPSITPGRERAGRTKCPDIIQKWTYGPDPVGDLHLLTTEHAHELLWAVFTGEPFTRVLNVLNDKEYIKGIAKDACVEVLVTVAGRETTGKQVTLPPAIHSLVQRWTTEHDLSINAAIHCDRDLAKQALFLDPHVTDLYDIEPMLEDFLTTLKPWLPEKWYR